jgi:hypothetical protein
MYERSFVPLLHGSLHELRSRLFQVMQPKTQLIAHDKEVYDIAFACGKDIFGTVGADGSLRMFDLRYASFLCVEGLGTTRLKLCCAYLPQ